MSGGLADCAAGLPRLGYERLVEFNFSANARPQFRHIELSGPAIDIGGIEFGTLHFEDPSNIAQLALGLACLSPLQLRENSVLCRRDVEHDIAQADFFSTVELGVTEGSIFPEDEIDLPTRIEEHDIELASSAPGFVGGLGAHVERCWIEGRDEGVESGAIRIDHQINVVRGPRFTVKCARERTGNHVRDVVRVEEPNDQLQRRRHSRADP